jgi:integrase
MPERDGLQYLGRRQDGRHTWRVRPYVGTPARRVSATFDMPTDSIKAARKRAAEVVDELTVDAKRTDAKRPTVAQLLDDWIERGADKKSPRTTSSYRRRAKKIARKFGSVRADQLTPDMIDAWYAELRRAGTSPAEVLELHRAFSAALQWARKLRRIPEAATEFVETPKHQPAKVDPPRPDVVIELLTNLPDHEWARCVALLVLTGMRRGEVVGLRWEDLDPPFLWVRHSVVEEVGVERVIVQPFPKSRDHRRIELHAATVAVLEQQRSYALASNGGKLPDWVFPDWDSWRLRDPRRPGSVSRSWVRYRKRHGGAKVNLHSLRHFHATQALAAGARVHDVADQLGHKDVATTIRIYGHGTDEGRKKVVDGVAGVLGLGGS